MGWLFGLAGLGVVVALARHNGGRLLVWGAAVAASFTVAATWAQRG